jgi:hypothetical protein
MERGTGVRIGIGIINALSVVLSVIFSYLLFIGGAFASDSGTTAAVAVSLAVMGAAFLYPIFTVFAIVKSQRKRSFVWAVAPLLLPLLLLGWAFTPWFSFS